MHTMSEPGGGAAVPALVIDSMSLTLDERRILTDVTLSLGSRRCVGFVGPNGAGKSSLFRVVAGLVTPSHGTVSVFGHRAGSDQALGHVRAVIGEPRFIPHLDGRGNLAVLAAALGAPIARADQALERCGLSQARGVKVSKYSQGMLRRLALASILIAPGDLTILDEPFDTLDTDALAVAVGIVQELAAEHTVLLAAHDTDLIEAVCREVVSMRDGRIVEHTAGRVSGESAS